MDLIYIIIIAVLLPTTVFLIIRQYNYNKRVSDMTNTVKSILDGQKKLQIFSQKNDSLGSLAYDINRLTSLYGTAEEKYEKEQLAKK